MAKRQNSDEPKLNYKSELSLARSDGPARLYILSGTEDYLREYFLSELKRICLPEGEDSFSYRRLNGPDIDALALREAVDAVPFLSERSFVEIREPDLNNLRETELLQEAFSDIPGYCTVVIVLKTDFKPDKRLKLNKILFSLGRNLQFDIQQKDALVRWIVKRFAALGKTIDIEAAQRLIFVSGELMNRLIPEIEKIASFAPQVKVTVADVNAVASRIPEAVIFEMTDAIAGKEYNNALSILSDLLSQKKSDNTDPVAMLGMLGVQMRRLYVARLASERELGLKFVMECCGIGYENVARNLMRASKGFTLRQLRWAVDLCAQADYRMKTSGMDSVDLLKETVLRIMAGQTHEEN